MEMIFGIVGAMTGIIGIVISLFSFYHNRIEAVNTFFVDSRAQECIRAKRVVRNLADGYNPEEITIEDRDQITYLMVHYEQTGLLVKKRQLPFWVFDKAIGDKTAELYEKLAPYIEMRKEQEPDYAEYFVYLYRRIKKRR